MLVQLVYDSIVVLLMGKLSHGYYVFLSEAAMECFYSSVYMQ